MAQEDIAAVLEDGQESMQKVVEALKRDLGRVRTGRASLALLDGIKIDYYGTLTPLNQMASLSVPESRMIVIQPWDSNMIGDIEKAINKSDLGVNPTNDGKQIRLVMPRPTEERRKELVKVVKKMGETSKVGIRACRRDCIDMLKSLEKDKDITEDENSKGQDEVQKLTDSFVKRIDEIIVAKEQEVMEI
ncbi:MAG: ribosome recycling factor [Deltaproteobacteria bacterium]|nr:ribosome recycling factor [Candidatus Anaeroferrophillus wilburensis]MBN2888048.1 ribosome recycling factor [Deltaproteobacteria bacterium]